MTWWPAKASAKATGTTSWPLFALRFLVDLELLVAHKAPKLLVRLQGNLVNLLSDLRTRQLSLTRLRNHVHALLLHLRQDGRELARYVGIKAKLGRQRAVGLRLPIQKLLPSLFLGVFSLLLDLGSNKTRQLLPCLRACEFKRQWQRIVVGRCNACKPSGLFRCGT